MADENDNLKMTLKKSRADLTDDATPGSPAPPSKESGSGIKIQNTAAAGQDLKETVKAIPKMVDPAQMRNKPKISMIGPQTGIQGGSPPVRGDVSSDTVVLKVIKEKKKKLAGMMSASQTIRLRPIDDEKAPAATPAPPGPGSAPAAPAAKATPLSKETLKFKPPGAGSGTKIGSAAAPPPTLQRPVLKVKQPGPAVTSAPPASPPVLKIKTPAASAPAAPPTPSPAASGAINTKATLKIKVPGAGEAPRAAAPPGRRKQARSTLKIKAPTGVAAPSPGAATGGKPARTLKLKAVPRPQEQTATGTAPAAAPSLTRDRSKQSIAQQKVVLPVKESSPDILYTVAAAASFAIVGITIGLMVTQFSKLF